MGWEDRPYYRDRGYRANRLGAFFSGSISTYSLFGIRVSIHNAMIVFLAGWVLLGPRWLGMGERLLSAIALIAAALIHEYGRCIAAWRGRGTGGHIVLWPLGGLALPESANQPGAKFWAALGGLMASSDLCALAAGLVWLLNHHHGVSLSFQRLIPAPGEGLAPAWYGLSLLMWWLFTVSYLLLLVNLLPVLPLDGGHILQAVMWRFKGEQRARLVACVVGMFAAGMLGVVGLALLNWATLGIVFLAVWLFLSCYQQRMILMESGARQPWQSDEHDYSPSLYREEQQPRRRINKRLRRLARRRALLEAAERQRLDAILAKVSASGLNSLTWRERRALRIATDKRRRQDEELRSLLGLRTEE